MASHNPSAASRKTNARRYTPAHGRDFEIEQIKAFDEFKTSRTRDMIAYLIFASVMSALVVAVGYGFHKDNFGPVKDVWTVAGPFIGGIVGYYFHRGRKASE